MSGDPPAFDPATVREQWDLAADGYAAGQASGRDYYRYEFFGPAQVSLCGDVRGLRLLDVGCGNGYFAREMARRGAQVTGIDLSSRMIEHARREESARPLQITYHVGDAAELDTPFAPGSFDIATSCVALQDMPRADQVFRAVHRVLRPGGRFVPSITHPCTDTPFRQWERDPCGAKRWLCIDRYFDREVLAFTWNWPGAFETTAMHRTVEDWFGWILGAGFVVHAVREPRPDAETLRRRPDLEDAARVPYYLMFDLVRGGGPEAGG